MRLTGETPVLHEGGWTTQSPEPRVGAHKHDVLGHETMNKPSTIQWKAALKRARALRETLLANLVLIGEIPSPTFGEELRIRFVLQRFTECGLDRPSSDERGNGMALIPGTEGHKAIVLTANADTLHINTANQGIDIESDRVAGPFVGDNSLALAALVTLPDLLDAMGIRFRHDLILLACARSLNRGNLAGLNFFLDHAPRPIAGGLVIEGVQLGRLNHACLGMLRGEITCRLPDHYDWAQYGKSGSILPMNDVITELSRIPLPQRPRSSLVLGSIRGGIAYHNIARQTVLRFEARSEELAILDDIEQRMAIIAKTVARQSGMEVVVDVFTRRKPGGIPLDHPLVQDVIDVMKALKIEPQIYHSTSPLSAFYERDLPAIALGLTVGERSPELNEVREYARIEPMAVGLTQLVGALRALDEESNDEPV